jgi:hypothetical protein
MGADDLLIFKDGAGRRGHRAVLQRCGNKILGEEGRGEIYRRSTGNGSRKVSFPSGV